MHSKMLLLACLIVPLFSFSSTTTVANKSVFILAGQSNMVGEGGRAIAPNNSIIEGWDGVVPPECVANPLILRLNGEMKWVEAHEPLSEGNGVGPGMAFSNSVLKRDPSIGVIGLVQCAVAGSSISSWTRGSKYYERMLMQTRSAMLDGTLRGFLWYQGESDTRNKTDAEAYLGSVKEVFNNVRNDLQSPSLRIIQVALASGYEFKETVRQAQLHTELANVTCVDAMGLPLLPDNLHLTTPAQVQLGTMLAHDYLQGNSGL